MVQHIRKSLRSIRDLATLPSTIMLSGLSAEETAHRYVLKGNIRRNLQKRKRDNNEFREGSSAKRYNLKENSAIEFICISSSGGDLTKVSDERASTSK